MKTVYALLSFTFLIATAVLLINNNPLALLFGIGSIKMFIIASCYRVVEMIKEIIDNRKEGI